MYLFNEPEVAVDGLIYEESYGGQNGFGFNGFRRRTVASDIESGGETGKASTTTREVRGQAGHTLGG